MSKLIFQSSKFFGYGHFLIHEILKNRQKMTGAKKFSLTKNQFSHARQPWKKIFSFKLLLYFYDWFLKLYKVIAKFCDLGGRSYLDQKCSPGLYRPNTGWAPWSKNLRATLVHTPLFWIWGTDAIHLYLGTLSSRPERTANAQWEVPKPP